MAILPPVICRICRKKINRNIEKENIDWIMPSLGWFYHKACYETWKGEKDHVEEVNWVLKIYDLISRDLKEDYNYFQIEQQRKKFIENGFTNKGIYLSLLWYFDVQKNKWREEFGIGIIPYIYETSREYWEQQYLTNEKLSKELRRLLEMKESTKTIEYVPKRAARRNIKSPE